VAAARWARRIGFGLQVNSLACKETADDLADLYDRVLELDADRWAVSFQLHPGGRAPIRPVDAHECEAILEWLCELTVESPRPVIETPDAPHFRRLALQQQRQATHARRGRLGWRHLFAATPRAPQRAVAGASFRSLGSGTRDGAGVMHISHTGEVYPASSLPLSVGNVKTQDVVRLYREAPLLVRLRDPARLNGRCGACEYRTICGGSRTRAWAVTGDPFEADPLCPYQPPTAVPPAQAAHV
jgi:radical SAM protein with 4Fe4S-binding SPASM domain